MSLPPSGRENHEPDCPSWSTLGHALRTTSAFFMLVPASIFSLYGALSDPEDHDAMLTGVIGFALCIAFLYPANPGPAAQSFSSRHRLLSPRLWDDLRSTPVLAAAHTAVTGAAAYVLYRAPGPGARQMFYGHVAGAMGLLPYLLDRALAKARIFARFPPPDQLTGTQRYALARGVRRDDLQEYRQASFIASWSRANWLLVAAWEGSLALYQWNLGRLLWHNAGGAPTHARYGMTGPSMQVNTYLLEAVAGALFHTIHLDADLAQTRTGNVAMAGLRLAAIAGRYHQMVGGAPLLIVLGLEAVGLGLRRELWRPALSGMPYAIPTFTDWDAKHARPPARRVSVVPMQISAPMPMAGPGPASAPPGGEAVVLVQLHPLPGGQAPGMPPISGLPGVPRDAWPSPKRDPADGI